MKIDFHTHTHFSYDSVMSAEVILKKAKMKGLDGIVICDHNTIAGGVEVSQLNNDPNFHVIIGAEIATSAGDITGLFLKREILSRNVNDVLKEIKDQGGVSLLNHPYQGHDLELIDFSKIDFIEGYNGRLTKDKNDKAVSLARKHKIRVLAGSDSHVPWEIGNCYSVIKDIKTLEAVSHRYKKSHQLFVTISQYIKAYKRRSLRVLYDANVMLLKYYLRKFRLIKN